MPPRERAKRILAVAVAAALAFTPVVLVLRWLLVASDVTVVRDEEGTGERVLLLGNSILGHTNVPQMLARISRSRASPKRLHVVAAWAPDARLHQLMENDDVQALLGERWDAVIMQPQSREAVTLRGLFRWGAETGARAAQERKGRALIMIPLAHALASDAFEEEGAARVTERHAFMWRTVDAVTTAAAAYGAEVVEVGPRAIDLDQDVYFEGRPFYEDDRHPSVRGAYFVAWAMYVALAAPKRISPAGDWWYPPELTGQDARALRQYAQRPAALAAFDRARYEAALAIEEAARREAAARAAAAKEAAAKAKPKPKRRRKRR